MKHKHVTIGDDIYTLDNHGEVEEAIMALRESQEHTTPIYVGEAGESGEPIGIELHAYMPGDRVKIVDATYPDLERGTIDAILDLATVRVVWDDGSTTRIDPADLERSQ